MGEIGKFSALIVSVDVTGNENMYGVVFHPDHGSEYRDIWHSNVLFNQPEIALPFVLNFNTDVAIPQNTLDADNSPFAK